jgi:hypothetical protein
MRASLDGAACELAIRVERSGAWRSGAPNRSWTSPSRPPLFNLGKLSREPYHRKFRIAEAIQALSFRSWLLPFSPLQFEWRMNGYGSHTYSFINAENERVWVGVTNPASPTDCFKRP